MTSTEHSFETGHQEMIHDVQLDYFGHRLATASSDRLIKIFDVSGNQQKHLADLRGHDGPVWQVSWGHPKYGSLLASCSYDQKIIVWKEEVNGQWIQIYEDSTNRGSVNSVSWCPHQYGIILGSACADGSVALYTFRGNPYWDRKVFQAHTGGTNAISWGPGLPTGAIVDSQQAQLQPVKRFVTGGNDNRIKIWSLNESTQEWIEDKVFTSMEENLHQNWVRDVSWAPSLGLPHNTIASASEDKTVGIYIEDRNGLWKRSQILRFDHKVWRVSWSVVGNILAVSSGPSEVSLWKEDFDGVWKNLSKETTV